MASAPRVPQGPEMPAELLRLEISLGSGAVAQKPFAVLGPGIGGSRHLAH